MSKYRAKKTIRTVNGEQYTFPSKAEALRFDQLALMQKAGLITDLKLQPTFIVANAFKIGSNKTKSGKVKIGQLKYTPDFQYTKDGENIVEEVKGVPTASYRIRMKLFLSCAYSEYKVDKFVEIVRGQHTEYFCSDVKEC